MQSLQKTNEFSPEFMCFGFIKNASMISFNNTILLRSMNTISFIDDVLREKEWSIFWFKEF